MTDGRQLGGRRRRQVELPTETPFNPLDKTNLGVSVSDALLSRDVVPLPPQPFAGAGIYALYYTGDFLPYAAIAAQNRGGQFNAPIYVGKAAPEGARKGGALGEAPVGPQLLKRLNKHANSIMAVENLNLADFWCRYLIVDDIWIPLGEELMIRRFRPIWNTVVDGFGINAPGGNRPQRRSQWDTLHPGRRYAANRPPNKKSLEEILANVDRFMKGLPAELIEDEEATEDDGEPLEES